MGDLGAAQPEQHVGAGLAYIVLGRIIAQRLGKRITFPWRGARPIRLHGCTWRAADRHVREERNKNKNQFMFLFLFLLISAWPAEKLGQAAGEQLLVQRRRAG